MLTRILVIGELSRELSDDIFILEKQLTVTNISKSLGVLLHCISKVIHQQKNQQKMQNIICSFIFIMNEFAKSKSLQEIYKKHKPPCVINLIHGIPALGYFSSDSVMGFIEL